MMQFSENPQDKFPDKFHGATQKQTPKREDVFTEIDKKVLEAKELEFKGEFNKAIISYEKAFSKAKSISSFQDMSFLFSKIKECYSYINEPSECIQNLSGKIKYLKGFQNQNTALLAHEIELLYLVEKELLQGFVNSNNKDFYNLLKRKIKKEIEEFPQTKTYKFEIVKITLNELLMLYEYSSNSKKDYILAHTILTICKEKFQGLNEDDQKFLEYNLQKNKIKIATLDKNEAYLKNILEKGIPSPTLFLQSSINLFEIYQDTGNIKKANLVLKSAVEILWNAYQNSQNNSDIATSFIKGMLKLSFFYTCETDNIKEGVELFSKLKNFLKKENIIEILGGDYTSVHNIKETIYALHNYPSIYTGYVITNFYTSLYTNSKDYRDDKQRLFEAFRVTPHTYTNKLYYANVLASLAQNEISNQNITSSKFILNQLKSIAKESHIPSLQITYLSLIVDFRNTFLKYNNETKNKQTLKKMEKIIYDNNLFDDVLYFQVIEMQIDFCIKNKKFNTAQKKIDVAQEFISRNDLEISDEKLQLLYLEREFFEERDDEANVILTQNKINKLEELIKSKDYSLDCDVDIHGM